MNATTAERPFPTYKRFLPGGTSSWGFMHVVNRTAGGLMLFGDKEKDYFRSLIFRAAEFCGLEVLTWTCLDNHFHICINVPSVEEAARLRATVTEEEILDRLRNCYTATFLKDTKQRLAKFRSTPGKEALADDMLRRFRAQMYDISAYMHIVQRRFSGWFNDCHDRKGTLWQGRFRSTLVESSGEALLKTAAYIDLNAVRAKIVTDPKDYPWCGYAEALAGKADARAGITSVVNASSGPDHAGPADAENALQLYRSWLLELGAPVLDETGQTVRPGFAAGAETSEAKLPRRALLSTRVRYFTASLAIGTRAFCEEVYHRYRSSFGPKRQSGARPLGHGDWGGLCGLRDLRKNVVPVTGV